MNTYLKMGSVRLKWTVSKYREIPVIAPVINAYVAVRFGKVNCGV
jgi:hypothetical protein